MSAETFTDEQPWTVEPSDFDIVWHGTTKVPWCCSMCMHHFEIGDTVRWAHCPSAAPNLFVCADCDGPDLLDRWRDRWHNVIRPIITRWGNP